MRVRKAALMVVTMMFFWAAGAAHALVPQNISGTPGFRWEGIGTSFETNLNFYDNLGISFVMYSWEDPANNNMALFSPGDFLPFTSVNVFSDPATGQYKATKTIPVSASIDLGSAPRFGFAFYDGVTAYLNYALTLTPGSTTSWNLFNSETGMTVNVQGPATPTPTPIPGSLLLMGSGLFGLVSFGGRKNKASMA
ncbi:MAG: hypothetical protein OEV91_11425 [Desulfobulbaceae bacterium]|nr:hypothetical protein [Desulfobulbaceae bacterium]